MLCQCAPGDAPEIYTVINTAAAAYRGVIPADCYHQPYMALEELKREMGRVTFYGWRENTALAGVMGIEPVSDVTLIRHAYVLPQWQRRGVGSKLLGHLKGLTRTRQLLVGTWAGASWAVDFYQKQGFRLLPDKDALLQKYWDIPRRQIETSVVLGLDAGREAG